MTTPRRLARARRATAVLATAVALTSAAAWAPAAAADSVVTPGQLVFGPVAAGESASRTTTLTAGHADAVLVAASATGTGTISSSLTSRLEACATPWTATGCADGGAALLAGPVDGATRTVSVPLPADGVAYLRVTLRLDEAAAPGASGSVTYRLALSALDDEPTGPLPVTGTDAGALAAAGACLLALGLALRRWARPPRPGGAA